MKNSYFIQTKCSDIANKILTAAIDTERTFKCNWPKHISSSVVNKPIPSFNASETFCAIVKSKNKFYDVQIQFLILFSLVSLNDGYLSCNTDCYYLKANIVKNLAACLIFMKYHIYNSSDCLGNIFLGFYFLFKLAPMFPAFAQFVNLFQNFQSPSHYLLLHFSPWRHCHMSCVIGHACLHTCLNLLRCAFYCTPKTDMNPSRQAVFGMAGLYS